MSRDASDDNEFPPLTDAQLAEVAAAREVCQVLYAGVVTPHRSCGIAVAETFGLPTAPYQALRRGGLTGRGECGAILGGRLVLGQILGDPDPTGKVTDALASAIAMYEALWPNRIDRRDAPGAAMHVVCNTLTGQFATFRGAERHDFCTDLATEVATVVAEVLVRHGITPEVPALPRSAD